MDPIIDLLCPGCGVVLGRGTVPNTTMACEGCAVVAAEEEEQARIENLPSDAELTAEERVHVRRLLAMFP